MWPVVVRTNVQSASRDGLESVDPPAIRIGLAIPLQGPGGIFGPSCEAVSELFRRQVNEAGLLGRPVELEVIDAGQPPEKVGRTVRVLMVGGRIDALTCLDVSSVREGGAPVFQQ